MLENLGGLGYGATDVPEEAELVILNTCSVREKPEHKVQSMLGRLGRLQRNGASFKVAVGGCMGKQHGEKLLDSSPIVDLVFGPDQIGILPDLVAHITNTGERVCATDKELNPETLFRGGGTNISQRPSGFVSIMKGCDQFCSYCIVPHVRGRELSRKPAHIIHELRQLIDRGVKEVCLLGQNVNRYGVGDETLPSFAELLREVHDLEGLERLYFITSNPGDCPDELINCFTQLPKLLSHFHLPMQSGSDRILKLMNRRYDRAKYFELVAKLREARPDIHISTDIIVGFPTESDLDFEETMSAAAELRWGSSFSFKYSPRPGTVAAKMADDVPPLVKKERLTRLQTLLFSTMEETLEAHVGETVSVLVEGRSRQGEGQLTGRTNTNYIMNFDLPSGGQEAPKPGDVVNVKVIRACKHSLVGLLADTRI
jgi:tRNA-2-methylthio-N6-dimethylallyladenosine synthase